MLLTKFYRDCDWLFLIFARRFIQSDITTNLDHQYELLCSNRSISNVLLLCAHILNGLLSSKKKISFFSSSLPGVNDKTREAK